jgi:SAM-dependent methyltransferase
MPESVKSITRHFARRVRDAAYNRAYRYAPEFGRQWWDQYLANKRTSESPDRAILLEKIFPRIVDLLQTKAEPEILWVGCARCTKNYYRILEYRGARCWTIDLDPSVRRWGRRGRHTIGDLLELPAIYPCNHFDIVLCNGVFGFGINVTEAQRAASEAMARCIRPGGWMLLGWNTNKIKDPLATGIVTPWFEAAELPGFGQRLLVNGCSHVYDFLKRR